MQNLWKKARSLSFIDRLLLLLLLFGALYLAAGLLFDARQLLLPFFDRGGDLFMDFFNSVRDAAQGPRVYTERRVIYPPLANLIFWLFGALVPSAYQNTTFAERATWSEYSGAIFALSLYLLLPTLLLILLFFFKIKKEALPPRLLFLLLFNLPLLYLIERGNLLLFTLPALFFFLFYYEDPRAGLRECSLVALSFAIATKLYPALFALILVARRRYAAFFRVALYSLLLVLLPSLPFGGIGGIWQMVLNILSFSDNADGTSPLFSYLPFLFSLSLFLLALWRKKSDLTLFFLGACALYFFPALHALYAYSLFLPFFLLLPKKPHALHRLLLRLVPLPLFFYPFLSSRVYALVADLVLYFALALIGAALFFEKRQKKHSP